MSLLTSLRAAIADRRVTQQEIARATGVDQSQVSRILGGHSKRSSANVAALCRFAAQMLNPNESGEEVPLPVRAHALVDALMKGGAQEQEKVVALLSQLLVLRKAWRQGGQMMHRPICIPATPPGVTLFSVVVAIHLLSGNSLKKATLKHLFGRSNTSIASCFSANVCVARSRGAG